MIRTVCGLALLVPALAAAHGRSVSYSSWTPSVRGAHVVLRVAALDVTMLRLDPWSDRDAVADWATRSLSLTSGDVVCAATTAPTVDVRDGWMTLAWSIECPAAPTAITSRLFADVAPSHLHFARLTSAGGAVTERVLDAQQPQWPIATSAAAPAASGFVFADYVRLGIDHIRTGADHLAFVLALVLLAGSLGEVVRVVTAFTVAHSLTLALAAFGVLHPTPTAVEATIGFSIALVAIENGWLLGGRDHVVPWLVPAALVASAATSRALAPLAVLGLALFAGCHLQLLARSATPARLRALVAFAFGLVHGLGFAGVLATLELPRTRLVPALAGFNVGVELGQLAVVSAAWLALSLLERIGARRPVAELGSAAICGLGIFWFATRAWG